MAALSASLGIMEDNLEHNFAVQWEDSFIMVDSPKQPQTGPRPQALSL